MGRDSRLIRADLPAKSTAKSRLRLSHSPDAPFRRSLTGCRSSRATRATLKADLKALGLLFESLVVRDLRVYSQVFRGELFHYRDESGLEVDAIVDVGIPSCFLEPDDRTCL